MATHPNDLADERGPRLDGSLVLSGLTAAAGLAWLVRALVSSPALPPPVAVSYTPPAALSASAAFVAAPSRGEIAWTVQQAQGVDERGRAVIFQLLSGKRLVWEPGSATILGAQESAARDLATELTQPPLAEALSAAHAVIAIGVAAFEEPTALAGRRADKLAEALAGRMPVWRLDLGRYLRPCLGCNSGDRSDQRPLALITVSAAHEGADLSTALRDALGRQGDSWPTPNRYERFRLVR